MQHATTDRGFDHMEPVPSEYGGQVAVSESSNAGYAGIWLRTTCPVSLNDPSGPTYDSAMNLTADSAWLLGRQLLWLVANHYQGDARPDDHFTKARGVLDEALAATGREHGDPQPTAEDLLDLLAKAGFALVRVSEATR